MEPRKRPDWVTYNLQMARHVATRSTCDRKHVGCVIVDSHNNIASVGYNGSPRGASHCDGIGHLMVGNNCVRTIHSEMNAIGSAARRGVSLDRATAFVTALPCFNCIKALYAAGVHRVYYGETHNALAWGWPVDPDDEAAIGMLFPGIQINFRDMSKFE